MEGHHTLERLTAALLLALGAGALVLFPITNTDIWWHLASGRWILEHGAWPHTDPFAADTAGRPWVDVHWLFQLIAYLTYRLTGLGGLVIAKAATVGLAAVVTLRAMLGAHRRYQGLAVGIVLAVLFPARYLVLARPIVPTLLGVGLVLLILEGYRRQRRAAGLLWLLPIQILWANVQSLFVLAPLLVACYLLGEGATYLLATRRLPGFASSMTTRQLGWLTLALFGVCLASLATPYGWDAVRLPFRLFGRIDSMGSALFSLNVSENVPLWLLEQRGSPLSAPFRWVALIAFGSFLLDLRSLSLPRLAVLGATFALAATAHRNALLLCWVAGPLVAANVIGWLNSTSMQRRLPAALGSVQKLLPSPGTPCDAPGCVGRGLKYQEYSCALPPCQPRSMKHLARSGVFGQSLAGPAGPSGDARLVSEASWSAWSRRQLTSMITGPGIIQGRNLPPDRGSFRSGLRVAPWIGVVAALGVIGHRAFVVDEGPIRQPAPFRVPTVAVKHLAGLEVRGPLFNSVRYGGYLAWALPADPQPRIDGRLVLRTAAEFAEHLSLLDEPAHFEAYRRRHGIRVAVLPSAFPDRYLALVAKLYEDPDWALLYTDGSQNLFSHRSAWTASTARPPKSPPSAVRLDDPVTISRIARELEDRFARRPAQLSQAVVNLGRLLGEVRQLQRGIELLETHPQWKVQSLLARLLYLDGQQERARRLALTVTTRHEDDLPCQLLLARIAMERNDLAAALKRAGRIIRSNPEDPEALGLIAEVRRRIEAVAPPSH